MSEVSDKKKELTALLYEKRELEIQLASKIGQIEICEDQLFHLECSEKRFG